VEHHGVGPAEIRTVSVKIDRRRITTWQQALERWKLQRRRPRRHQLSHLSRPRSSCPPSAVAFDNH
jgi:ribosomal protein L13E